MLRRIIQQTHSSYPSKRCFHTLSLVQQQQQQVTTRYTNVELPVNNNTQRVVLTLNELGPMDTHSLYNAMQERYPNAFESKSDLRDVLSHLRNNRRIDAKQNPLKEVLKKKEGGYQYHLTLKEKKRLLNKRKAALKASEQGVTQEQEEESSTVETVEAEVEEKSTEAAKQ